jgi:hypothetical protein
MGKLAWFVMMASAAGRSGGANLVCMTNPLRADRREKGNCFRAPRSDARGPFSRREKEKNREEETATHGPFVSSRVAGRNPFVVTVYLVGLAVHIR